MKAAKDRDGYAPGRQEQVLRVSLANMPLLKFLSPTLMKKSRVMEEPGLPEIFQNEKAYNSHTTSKRMHWLSGIAEWEETLMAVFREDS